MSEQPQEDYEEELILSIDEQTAINNAKQQAENDAAQAKQKEEAEKIAAVVPPGCSLHSEFRFMKAYNGKDASGNYIYKPLWESVNNSKPTTDDIKKILTSYNKEASYGFMLYFEPKDVNQITNIAETKLNALIDSREKKEAELKAIQAKRYVLSYKKEPDIANKSAEIAQLTTAITKADEELKRDKKFVENSSTVNLGFETLPTLCTYVIYDESGKLINVENTCFRYSKVKATEKNTLNLTIGKPSWDTVNKTILQKRQGRDLPIKSVEDLAKEIPTNKIWLVRALYNSGLTVQSWFTGGKKTRGKKSRKSKKSRKGKSKKSTKK
jgi:hypothetical protein